MKELTLYYLALLLIAIAGCSTTRSYSLYDANDLAALAREKVVKIELENGTVYYGTNLHFGADWMSFTVASDQGWPPPGDFFTYDMGVPFDSIVRLSNTAKETNKRNVRIAIVIVALSALVIGLAVALNKFCEGKQNTNHAFCD